MNKYRVCVKTGKHESLKFGSISRYIDIKRTIPTERPSHVGKVSVSRGRFSPSTSVSLAIHSTKFSILTITRGRYNRPVSGRRAEWTQFGLHPPLCKLKKK
jgi:hypothetical protein